MILITGANGFLGSYISKRLKEDGYSVLNYGRDKLDVLNKLSVERTILDNDIKCVIHTAIKGGRRTREDTAQDFYNNLFMFENLVAHRDKFDFMINRKKDNFSKVFKTETELINNGFIDASNNDFISFNKINNKIGLVYH